MSDVKQGESSEQPAPALDPREFRNAAGHFLTGVTVVTARAADGTPVGFTANSFTSVSLDPPLVLVCLDKRSSAHDAFSLGSHFAIHVLGDHQEDISRRFAMRGIDKFAGLDRRTGLGGVPLLPGYVALLECTVWQLYEGGDHTIFVGRVERLEATDADRLPLGFLRGRYAYVGRTAAVPTLPADSEMWGLGWG